MTFNELGLSEDVLRGIEELGFVTPTPIQGKVIPLFFETHDDIIGLAQTGTGKTAAFGLPIIETVNTKDKNIQAVVLSPTRELAMQIAKDMENFSKHVPGFKVVCVYGGASIDTQVRAIKKGVQVVVATPGRMLDLINRRVLKIQGIRTLVLDEADEMLNMGFRDELDGILANTPEDKRTLLFSATMPAEIANIAKNYMLSPVKITVGKQNAGAENVRHVYYQVHAKDRYLALKRIADINPDIYGIVFCRTRQETKEVADKLIKDGYNADSLHGDLSQVQRDLVMKRFRERALQMLVATDVAARGLDVSDISHVINYNLPEELEIYTHRSGRTGRADKSGTSIAIVNYREKNKIPLIEKVIRKKFEKLPVPGGMEICEKQLFNFIDKMEKVEVDEAQIDKFMDPVHKKLEQLDKEQIIKRFVSLEFNRFLEYYKNAPDLNKSAKDKTSDKSGSRDRGRGRDRDRGERGDRGARGDRSSSRGDRGGRRGDRGMSRMFINLGKKDRIEPKNIIGVINDHAKDRDIYIGEIEIKDNFSFFEVPERFSDKVIDSLHNQKYKGRQIRVEGAEAPTRGGKKKGDRRKRK